MDSPFISKDGLDTVKKYVFGQRVEACGFLFQGPELEVYFESYGDNKMCQHSHYTRYIWHTHPHNLKAYPSPEDIVKIIKARPPKNYPKVSIIFTTWGIWEVSSGSRLDNLDPDYLLQKIDATSESLYRNTERGRVLEKQPVHDYIQTVLHNFNKKGIKLRLNFTPWDEIRDRYYLRNP